MKTCVSEVARYPFVDLGAGAFSCDERDAAAYGVIYPEYASQLPEHANEHDTFDWQRCCILVIPAHSVVHDTINLSMLRAQVPVGRGFEKMVIVIGAYACVSFSGVSSDADGSLMSVVMCQGAQAIFRGVHEAYGRKYFNYVCAAQAQLVQATLQRGGGARSYTYRMAQEAVVVVRDVCIVPAGHELCVKVAHEHVGQKSNADSFFLTIVGDHASIRNEHNVVIDRGVKDVASSLRSKAVLMGDGAHAYASPGLCLAHGLVRCAHGAAISSLDSEILWALRARGIAGVPAENMLLQAMVHEAIGSHIAQEDIKNYLAAR